MDSFLDYLLRVKKHPKGGGRKNAELVGVSLDQYPLSDVKSVMQGTLSRDSSKTSATCYLAEFEYHFHRRFKLDAIVPGLAHSSVQKHPRRDDF